MAQLGFVICEIAFVTAAIIFMHQKKKRDSFKRRIAISSGVLLAVILFTSGSAMSDSLMIDMIFQVMVSICTMIYLKINWEISFSIAIYDTLFARLFWWILVEVARFVFTMLVYLRGSLPKEWICAGLILFLAAGLLLLAKTVALWIPENRSKIGPRQLLSAVLISTIFENLAFLPEIRNFHAGIDRWVILFLLQLICIFIMYLQNELFRKSAMRQELEFMNLLLKKEQEQYRLSKENIAIINQKCHDLKHQIRVIRQLELADKDQYLKEVEDSIRIYESIVKTGNEVLDTILTEKSLYCQEKGILVSCVADGKLLSFIQTMDLYSLFGNALDNAIEAVEKLQVPQMRQIDVLVFQQERFLVIHIVNPVEEQLTFEDGLPVTTKPDHNYHGFGIRSMQYIVKKYNGHLDVSQEDGCFSLKMLIPM